MPNIQNPQPRRFSKMTQDMALLLMREMNIHETCPLALVLDDELSRTNLECLCRWLRQQAERHDLEPRMANKHVLVSKLSARLEDLFDPEYL